MEIKDVIGRWPGILMSLGINIGEAGKHTACPICGPGRNNHRFRFDDKDGKGTWICNQCGAGDGWTLVQNVFKTDFKGALEIVRNLESTPAISKPQPEPKASRAYLRELYTRSTPISPEDLGYKYLTGRGLSVIPETLRFHPACFESESKLNLPAILATVILPNNEAVTIHRIYLSSEGEKAKIQSPKKTLTPLKKMSGGAIRLFPQKDGVLGIAEGIETAIAASEISGFPVWATMTAGMMEAFEPPEGIKEVVIFGDKDRTFTGQKAAYTLANKLVVQNKLRHVEVMLPPQTGDWLDELNGRRG